MFLLWIGLFCFGVQALDAAEGGNHYWEVRYLDGSMKAKVNRNDWKNVFGVEPGRIVLVLKDRQQIEIKPSSVTRITYGEEAHFVPSMIVAFGVWGLLARDRKYLIGIEYESIEAGRTQWLLLQFPKKYYRAILHSLRAVTGQKIEIGGEP